MLNRIHHGWMRPVHQGARAGRPSVPEFGDDSPTRPRRGGGGGEVSEGPSPGRGAARAARATKLRTVTRTLPDAHLPAELRDAPASTARWATLVTLARWLRLVSSSPSGSAPRRDDGVVRFVVVVVADLAGVPALHDADGTVAEGCAFPVAP